MAVVAAACNVGAVVPADAPITSDASIDAPGPGLAITPSQTDFGAVGVGQTSAHVAVVVSTGSPTGVLSVSFVGPNASDFTSIGGNCDGAVLAQPGSCTEWVVFRPTALGSRSATLRITGAPGGTVTAALLGTAGGLVSNFVISPTAMIFATVAVGQASATQQFTTRNPGPASIGPLVTQMAGTDAAQFEVVTTLHDFGTAPLGLTSPPFTFTVMNTGVSPSAPLVTTIGASSNPPFAIVAGTDTCSGIMLAAGASCTLQIRFTPTSFGVHSGSLDVTDGVATATSNLTGLTAGNDFNTLLPSQYVFPDVVVGASSAPQLFTVTNGPWTTHASGMVAVSGPTPSEFSIVGDNCSGASLAPGAACTFAVVFSPTSPGQKSRTIYTMFTPGGVNWAAVTGTGVTP